MNGIMKDERLHDAYRRLAGVTLNPRRHTAPNALAHSEAVAARAAALAEANGCTARERELLEDLGRVHDIGKITGTAHPERSLDVLREHGVTDRELLALVRWHDTALPWWKSSSRGEPPSDKAWRKLAGETDIRLLALFMVADRVDAPPGWRRNPPTVWFHAEARRRGLLGSLVVELPGVPSEVSAGGVLVEDGAALLIRVRSSGLELPKGGIEWDELAEDAAAREAREEVGITSALRAGDELGHVDYEVGEADDRHVKRVRYYALHADGPVALADLPDRTRARVWLRPDEVAGAPLVNESLRPILTRALAR